MSGTSAAVPCPGSPGWTKTIASDGSIVYTGPAYNFVETPLTGPLLSTSKTTWTGTDPIDSPYTAADGSARMMFNWPLGVGAEFDCQRWLADQYRRPYQLGAPKDMLTKVYSGSPLLGWNGYDPQHFATRQLADMFECFRWPMAREQLYRLFGAMMTDTSNLGKYWKTLDANVYGNVTRTAAWLLTACADVLRVERIAGDDQADVLAFAAWHVKHIASIYPIITPIGNGSGQLVAEYPTQKVFMEAALAHGLLRLATEATFSAETNPAGKPLANACRDLATIVCGWILRYGSKPDGTVFYEVAYDVGTATGMKGVAPNGQVTIADGTQAWIVDPLVRADMADMRVAKIALGWIKDGFKPVLSDPQFGRFAGTLVGAPY